MSGFFHLSKHQSLLGKIVFLLLLIAVAWPGGASGRAQAADAPVSLPFTQPVTEIVYSQDGSQLFAITQDNRLLQIRTGDLTLQDSLPLAGTPVSIVNERDQLYVGLGGSANQIQKIDTQNGTTVRGAVYTWNTDYPVNQVLYDGKQKLYYTSTGNSYINVIDTVYGTRSNFGQPARSLGRMAWSPDHGELYFADDGVVRYRVSDGFPLNVPATWSPLPQPIQFIGDSLFVNSCEVDRYTLVFKICYSSGAVLSVLGDHVLAQNRVLNKSTRVKEFSLPATAKQALVLPDGAIVLLSSDGLSLVKYNSFESLRNNSPDYQRPDLELNYFKFFDNDPMPGMIGGELNWRLPPGNYVIQSFVLYFLDQDGRKVGEQLSEIPSTGMYNYRFNVNSTPIPSGAMYLGLFTKNAGGESLSAARDQIVDVNGGYSIGGVYSSSLEDRNPVRGEIRPYVTWINYHEGEITGYRLSFVSISGVVLSSREVDLNATPGAPYQVSFDETDVPNEAVYIDLYARNSGGTYPFLYRMQVFDATWGSSLSTHNIIETSPLDVTDVSFEDNDYRSGYVSGLIRWHGDFMNSAATSYKVYFMADNNTKLMNIADIPRSSLVRQYNNYLPQYEVTLSEGIKVPSGTVKIGVFTNSAAGEEAAGTYIWLIDLMEYDWDGIYFEDRNKADGIDGVLQWVPISNEAAVPYYQVEFVGDRYSVIGEPLRIVERGLEIYQEVIEEDSIPTGTTGIQVVARSGNDERLTVATFALADNIQNEPVSTRAIDNIDLGSVYSSFYDQDGEAGQIAGDVSIAAVPNSAVKYYEIYFVNETHQKIKPLSRVHGDSNIIYPIHIPNHTVVPEGATQLAVFAVTERGEKFMAIASTQSPMDRVFSPPLSEGQIQITNNKEGTPDTITVTGLNSADLVRVYTNVNSYNPIAVKTADMNARSVTISVEQLGTTSGTLYFTLTRGTDLRSPKIAKTYSAETTSPTKPGAGAIGGGGGGGGGSSQQPPSLNADGKMEYQYAPPRVDLLIELNSEAKEVTLDARTKEKVELLKVKLDADILAKAAERNKALVIQSNAGTIMFPPGVFGVSEAGAQIEFRLALEPAPNVPQFSRVSSVFDFQISEQGKPIGDFKKPVTVTLPYDASKVQDPSRIGVYLLDEQTGSWTLVGGTRNTDGTITVNLPHFSKYAVLERLEVSSKTFSDIQNHWAQKEIEALAAKQVISGMDEQTFQPDAPMTRAQFVTLLANAFRLKSSGESKGFEDVPSDAWYHQAVYAAYEAGIVSGVGDHTFAPEARITREQMAVLMVKAYLYQTGKKLAVVSGSSPYQYTDAEQIQDWARVYVEAAAALNLMNGAEEGRFAPQADTTRAQAAVVLYRVLNQLKL